ncbi:MAG: hypothetical protein LBK82_14055 [Planctomycetaceae bacterium]|jgi:hypothetical protein|nr:hypothetical protein [Planctomycetaceae bacterium]
MMTTENCQALTASDIEKELREVFEQSFLGSSSFLEDYFFPVEKEQETDLLDLIQSAFLKESERKNGFPLRKNNRGEVRRGGSVILSQRENDLYPPITGGSQST